MSSSPGPERSVVNVMYPGETVVRLGCPPFTGESRDLPTTPLLGQDAFTLPGITALGLYRWDAFQPPCFPAFRSFSIAPLSLYR